VCRLFAMTGGAQPVRATFWLLEAPDSLSRQSHRDPDGTGLGSYDAAGRPQVDKAPIAAFEDKAFAGEARTLESTTFVAHVRFASTGNLTVANTHPFEQAGRLFAHNGVVGDLPRVDAELGEQRALVGGDTDSERVFALVTREIEAHEGDARAGITAAAGWVAAQVPVYALNLVLITDSELFALRYPETHALHVLERAAGGHTGERPLTHRSRLGTRVHSEHGTHRPMVVVASETMDDDPGWRALASGELLHVASDLSVTSTVVLPDPPAHPLTLHDLDERARASQTATPAQEASSA
jgi:predicted glutamine amidotransferase